MTTHEKYKERLRAFNNTEKYRNELEFLYKMVAPMKGEKILDYGCGLGTAVRYFNQRVPGGGCYGYDINNYRDFDDEFSFRSEYHFRFDKVFFMHSLAHVPNPEFQLDKLRLLLKPDAKLYVVTPNLDWLNSIPPSDNGYIPDETVVNHFSLHELNDIFKIAEFTVLNIGQFGKIGNWHFNERLFLEAQL